MICNSVFQKKENQLITYESGGVACAVDYVLTNVGDWKTVLNMKTIPGNECVRQHRLLITVLSLQELPVIRSKRYEPKLKVWKLKYKQVQTFVC